MKLRGPVPIAIALAIVGVAGGVTVNVLGSRISRADREAIVVWERRVAALVTDARELTLRFDAIAIEPAGTSGAIERARAELDDVRRRLPTVPTAKILFRTTELMTMWMFESQEALVLLERARNEQRRLTEAERSALTEQLVLADGLYEEARAALIGLRCRARLDGCEQTVLPA